MEKLAIGMGVCRGGSEGTARLSCRSDHQEEEWGDPLPPGRGGLRGPPQLHLQVRRQIQQVSEPAPRAGGCRAVSCPFQSRQVKTLREKILSPQPGVPGPSHAATPTSYRLAARIAVLSVPLLPHPPSGPTPPAVVPEALPGVPSADHGASLPQTTGRRPSCHWAEPRLYSRFMCECGLRHGIIMSAHMVWATCMCVYVYTPQCCLQEAPVPTSGAGEPWPVTTGPAPHSLKQGETDPEGGGRLLSPP